MANIKSQIKRNRQNEKARVRNRAARSELRTSLRSAEAAIGTDGAAEAVAAAVQLIDKAASKGVIHRNAAARQKSRLMLKLNAADA